ncbi:hypothetical protein [Campylobacter sp. 19-13652]|uniref:hypothetical protein n=1 Tax=Campylobacter sp. 19-13652 TaxID=2840180 RepID=UPI001C78E21C|nr:hypothetical protein [Campylobacter sp. 19-13652]BCX79703.1 hypothetical protein LBC_11650 [Campylobacter sp. 19-13652]
MSSLSFTKVTLRPIFSLFSKIWLSLIGLVFVVLLGLNLFISYKNSSNSSERARLAKEQELATQKTAEISELLESMQAQGAIAKDIQTSNMLLKQSLHNLFDLVPDSITLEEVTMDKNSLIIKGITPTQDAFNQLLATPLASIFTTSNTSFYQIKNGWYGFISTNKMDNSEGYNE